MKTIWILQHYENDLSYAIGERGTFVGAYDNQTSAERHAHFYNSKRKPGNKDLYIVTMERIYR